MTFPERRLEWPLDPPEAHAENVQDVIPPTERSQDPATTEMTQGLTLDGSRPLTEAERKAAEHEKPAHERVYAPASERVPREPVPGHRDFVEHPDTTTPERQAVAGGGDEPSFTRVPRPSTAPGDFSTPMPDDATPARGNRWVPVAVGWAVGFGTCAGVAGWMWWRWQRERNKPINRFRRQARQTAYQAMQTAYELRERMPSGEEAARPAVGLSTALLSVLILLWQQSRARSQAASARGRASKATRRGDKAARQAMQMLSETDWQDRLARLKERWDPRRLELEKRSITRH
jgi:hypothetical protein